MSEFTSILPDDDNIEIVEGDYIIEEIDDNNVNIKEEMDVHDRDIFSDTEEYTHIVCLGKDSNTDRDIYHCAPCNSTFDSIENHLKEYHDIVQTLENTVTFEGEGFEEIIEHEVKEIEIGAGAVKIELTEMGYDHSNGYTSDSIHNPESQKSEAIHINQTLTCNDCKYVLDSEADIETHQCVTARDDHIASVFSCPECPKQFSLINLLQQHQKTHKPKRALKKQKQSPKDDNKDKDIKDIHHCDICNTTFSSSKNLKLHSKMHLTIPTKTIKDAMPIETHSSIAKNQFYCEICNKSFDHALLSVHQNMHQNVEEHNCSICNRQFENQISYDMHMQLHADQPSRVRTQQVSKPGAKFPCNYCGKEYLRPHEKVKHERIHTGQKPHECEVCGKSFRVSYSLTLHLRTHTDVRPYVCAQCNKRFKSYAVYSHHLNIHSDDRPYKCTMCPKAFRTSVQLCGHKNSHTKPYTCPECNRPFASLYAVKMHMKTHNKANKSNENLKHRCKICGAVYARMFALRFHMKEQHAADLTEEQNNDTDKQLPITADDCFNEDEVSTQAILQEEEIIIDNFHTEEIVTDWLTNK